MSETRGSFSRLAKRSRHGGGPAISPPFGMISKKDRILLQDALDLRCDAFLTMEKERKLPAAAEHVERHTGLRIMRPATYWGVLARWAALYY